MNKKFLAFTLSMLTIGLVLADAQIIIDPITKKITITGLSGTTTTGSTIQSGSTTTGTIQNTGISTTTIKPTTTVQTGTEFERALSRLYTNGITKYNTQSGFRMYDLLTREEAAKMIVQTYIVLRYPQTTKNNNCAFLDQKLTNPELSGYIQKACQRNLMKGNANKFMPTQQLTRPESMAILVRMFEGKTSYEAKNPWRSDYYIKGKALGLTSLSTTNFEKEISRYEIALYIYRLQNIANDSSLVLNAQQKLQNLTGIIQTTTTTGSSTTQNSNQESSELAQRFSAIANSISVEKDPELQEAIRWMNDNKLTNYSTIADYKPFEVLLREQAAKIFDIFAKVFNFSQDKISGTLPTECQFKDISKADGSLITNIENICKMDIIKGTNQIFDPKGTLTKGQFITALIRLVDGKKDETTNPRRTNYYQKALDMGIVGPADAITFDSPITRYEVALFLYRFKVKYQLINNLNTNTLDNMIINTMSGSIKTITNTDISGTTINTKIANIYIDTNLIQNGNFELGYIELLNNTYKVIKTSTENYFTKNFVRYGDLYDINKDTKTGTINFVVSNKTVIDGTIRINSGNSYKIEQAPETTAYYIIKQQH